MSVQNIDDLFRDGLKSTDYEFNPDAWSKMEEMLPQTPKTVDDVFREQLYAREVTFNEGAWQRMEALLPPASYTPVATLFYRVAAGLALLVGVGAGLWYFGQSSTDTPPLAENQLLQEEQKSIGESSSSPGSASAQTNEPDNVSADATEALLNPETSENISSTETTAGSSNQNTIEVSPNNSIEQAASAASLSIGIQASEAATDHQATEVIQPPAGSSLADQSGATQGSEMESATFTDLPIAEPLFLTSIPYSYHNADEASENEVSDAPIYVAEIPKQKPLKRHALGILGGVNMAKPFDGGGYDGSVAGNVFGGLSYHFRPVARWEFQTNILYQFREGIDTQRSFRGQQYDFGGSIDVLTITNQELHYLELPLMAGFYMNPRVKLTAGAQVAYLLDSKDELLHEHHGTFDSWSRTYNENGHREGLADWDVSLNLGVEYEILPAITVGGRAHYGLTDVTENTYYGTNHFDNNIQFRVFAGYNFLRF